MSFLVPSTTPIGEFTYREGSHLTTRPAAAFGTSITPGNNTYGTAVQIGANTVEECWGLLIGINSIGVTTVAKDSLTQIGFDFSGAGTFPATPDRFNSVELLTSDAGPFNTGGQGVQFYFPIYLPAGTAIMARGSTNNATVGTQNAWWQLFGRPNHPEAIRRGVFIQSMGTTPATSNGTALTPGTTAEGTAVSVGTLTDEAWFWEWGVGQSDSVVGVGCVSTDILIGSTSGPLIIENLYYSSTVTETHTKSPSLLCSPIASIPAGTEIFARMQHSGSISTGHSVAVYAVGG